MSSVKQITTDEMRSLLDRFPEMSAPTRRVLETGQAVFTDADGTSYQAPLTEIDEGPTHHMRADLMTKKDQSWN